MLLSDGTTQNYNIVFFTYFLNGSINYSCAYVNFYNINGHIWFLFIAYKSALWKLISHVEFAWWSSDVEESQFVWYVVPNSYMNFHDLISKIYLKRWFVNTFIMKGINIMYSCQKPVWQLNMLTKCVLSLKNNVNFKYLLHSDIPEALKEVTWYYFNIQIYYFRMFCILYSSI